MFHSLQNPFKDQSFILTKAHQSVSQSSVNCETRYEQPSSCHSFCREWLKRIHEPEGSTDESRVSVSCCSREMLTGQRLCQSKSHQDAVLSALNQQRKDGLLCDVTLVAGEQKFHAHKAVLAACSDYFRVSPGPFTHLDVWQMCTGGLWVPIKGPHPLVRLIGRICTGLHVYKKQVSVRWCSATGMMEVTSCYVTAFRDSRFLKARLTLRSIRVFSHIFRLKFRGDRFFLNVEVFIQRKLEISSLAIPSALSISVVPEAQRQLPDRLTGDRPRGEKMRFDLGDSEQIRNEKLIPPPLPENDRQD